MTTPPAPATARQVAYLRSVAGERSLPADVRERIDSDGLTATAASELTDRVLNAPPAARQPASKRTRRVGGVFMLDGVVHRLHQPDERAHPYAQRLVVTPGGKPRWVYAPGMADRCVLSARITMDEAVAFGTRTGVCGICGQALSNPVSVARGIGPVCITQVMRG